MKFPCFDVTFVFKSCCFSFDFASSVLIYLHSLYIRFVFFLLFILENFLARYLLSHLPINNNINILFLICRYLPSSSLPLQSLCLLQSISCFFFFFLLSLLQPACSYLSYCWLLSSFVICYNFCTTSVWPIASYLASYTTVLL